MKRKDLIKWADKFITKYYPDYCGITGFMMSTIAMAMLKTESVLCPTRKMLIINKSDTKSFDKYIELILHGDYEGIRFQVDTYKMVQRSMLLLAIVLQVTDPRSFILRFSGSKSDLIYKYSDKMRINSILNNRLPEIQTDEQATATDEIQTIPDAQTIHNQLDPESISDTETLRLAVLNILDKETPMLEHEISSALKCDSTRQSQLGKLLSQLVDNGEIQKMLVADNLFGYIHENKPEVKLLRLAGNPAKIMEAIEYGFTTASEIANYTKLSISTVRRQLKILVTQQYLSYNEEDYTHKIIYGNY